MEQAITEFIRKQKVATICCIDEEGLPYCFSCFYAFGSADGVLYFKSLADTRHIPLMLKNRNVAGTIMPDKLNVLAIKGIQFQGVVVPLEDETASYAQVRYHTKYPFAVAMSGEVWTIQITNIKMTDNSKGFGNKITWNRNEPAMAISNN